MFIVINLECQNTGYYDYYNTSTYVLVSETGSFSKALTGRFIQLDVLISMLLIKSYLN